MVSTRSQASNLHEPRSSPSKTPTGISAGTSGKKTWAHTPSNLTLLWLIVSLPLVFWDTGYVLLRPHSMPGGSLHSPIWIPYALYGTIDYIYGWPAYNAHNGFTAAQGSLNVVESVFYMYYLWIVYKHGRPSSTKGRGAPKPSAIGWLGEAKIVPGRAGAIASVVAFSAAIMTVSKTLLYWLNEYFSGFENIGHNDLMTLIPLWIIPNGAWLIFPTYMIYVFTTEILEGLAIASGSSTSPGVNSPRKDE